MIRSIKSFVSAIGTHRERKRVNKCRLYVEWLSLFLGKRKTLLIWFPLQFNRNKACSGDKNFLSSFLTDVDEVNYLWSSKHKPERVKVIENECTWEWQRWRTKDRRCGERIKAKQHKMCKNILYIWNISHERALVNHEKLKLNFKTRFHHINAIKWVITPIKSASLMV